MKRIIGTRESGKTMTLVKNAITNSEHNSIVFVTECPDYIKGMVRGLNPSKDILILTYKEFLAKLGNIGHYKDIYIDGIDCFLKTLCEQIKGYTLDVKKFLVEVE